MNEQISNMDLYHLCRSRPICNPDRRHSASVVWPSEPASVPSIPLNEYDRIFRQTIDDTNRVNQRVTEYIDGLNDQRKPQNGP